MIFLNICYIMTGGFNTEIRGIEINVTETMNRFTNQNRKTYTREEFENYLKFIGLSESFADSGEYKPINTGFVVSFEFEQPCCGEEEETAFGMLATGLWEYQYWGQQKWSKDLLEKRREFYNVKFLDIDIEKKLRSLWKDILVVNGDFTVYSIGCEWSHPFHPQIN